MKRKLINFGIFCPANIKGKKLQNKLMISVYNKLKLYGFRETIWQYIYNGQIGGLVLPYNDGKSEIHVRFYKDRIVAEYEIGRSYISHLFGTRYNANKFLLKFIKLHLNRQEYLFLNDKLSYSRLLEDEQEMLLWDSKSDYYRFARAKDRMLSLSVALSFPLGWKTSLLSILFLILASYPLFENMIVGGVTIVSWAFLWNLLPAKGKP